MAKASSGHREELDPATEQFLTDAAGEQASELTPEDEERMIDQQIERWSTALDRLKD